MSPLPDPLRQAARKPLLTAVRSGGPAAGPALDRAALPVRPVCAIHPGALPSTVWQSLAARLPEDSAPYVCDLGTVPAYFAAGLDPTAPVAGVGDLAALCLAELTAAGLTERPFTLVGWSFGGVVAYEIAARLDARGLGGTLEALVVLDSIAPIAEFERAEDELEPARLLDWFAMYLGARRGRRLTVDPRAFEGRRVEEDGLGILLDAAVAQGVLPADTEEAGLRKLFGAFRAGLVRNTRCTAGYLPDPLDRAVTVVRPERTLLPESPDLGWSRLSGRPLVRLDVPGDHYTLLQEPETVAALAALLGGTARATAPRTG